MSEFNTNREHYRYFSRISTRWMDNDIYGHINNVHYYSFFDTVANEFLIREGGLDIQSADVVAYIVASSCQYLQPLSHPAELDAAFRVNRLGNSSVEYGIAIFSAQSQHAAAWGTYTHVFVERATDKPCPIPGSIRQALSGAMVVQAGDPELP